MSRWIIFLLPFIFLTISSCIKEEPLNSEADILTATIDAAGELLQTDPAIGNTTVIFRLKKFDGNFRFAPRFMLTEGASIEPESGTERDFSTPQNYTVTSQDGHWQKTYAVSFVVDATPNYTYDFERVRTINTTNPDGHYHEFYDILPDGQEITDWSSGNEGFNILAASLAHDDGVPLTPSFYPTFQTEDGYIGKGVQMQTKGTGPLGNTFGSPLAAGNLFIGNFKLAIPAINSTHFGQPYAKNTAPVALRGYFKYKAGDKFIVNNAPSALTRDTWSVYAIIFEKSDGDEYLSGDHDFKDPRMVSLARSDASKQIETDQWTLFEIPFHFIDGKTYDPDKEYMFTIVFSSSAEGAKFNGAVGSTLWIDEVELVTE